MSRERPLERVDILKNSLVISELHERMAHRKSVYQPKPEDFKNEPGYSVEDIDAELDRVKKIKESWQEEGQREKVASVIEGIIVDQFSSKWLSEKATGHFTAEADDVLRGIDVVAEIIDEEERHYLGFAIDVTMAEDPTILEKKLEKIWQNDIEKRRFPEVKYVETDNYKGSVELPRVVIGINKDFTRKLIELEFSKKREELSSHPFQIHLIWQIKEQLENYNRYAKLSGDKEFLAKIENSLAIFYKLIQDKREVLDQSHSYVAGEQYYQDIRSFGERKIKAAKKFFTT